jgi:hypothetical protein
MRFGSGESIPIGFAGNGFVVILANEELTFQAS